MDNISESNKSPGIEVVKHKIRTRKAPNTDIFQVVRSKKIFHDHLVSSEQKINMQLILVYFQVISIDIEDIFKYLRFEYFFI